MEDVDDRNKELDQDDRVDSKDLESVIVTKHEDDDDDDGDEVSNTPDIKTEVEEAGEDAAKAKEDHGKDEQGQDGEPPLKRTKTEEDDTGLVLE